jgi:hypothetical protein
VKSSHPSIPGSGLTVNGDDLPDGSRVVRYVPYGRMEKDENDNFLRPLPSAFEARVGEEYLSVTWCDYFEGLGDQRLRCAVEAIRGSMKVAPKACFCLAGTSEILDEIHIERKDGHAIYLPVDNNQAHAGIYGIDRENTLLQSQLAGGVWCQFLTKEAADTLPSSSCTKSSEVE